MSNNYVKISGSISHKGQSGLFSQKMLEVAQKHRDKRVKELAAEGERLCYEAYQTKNTKNRTGTQANAYFFVVCHNGIIYAVGNARGVGGSDLFVGSANGHKGLQGTWWKDAGGGQDWWVGFEDSLGKLIRQEAPKARTSKDKYDLFILNAAYYTSWLEDGSYSIGLSKIFGHAINPKHYHVISQIKASCEAVASKYGRNSKVTRVGIHGEPMKPAIGYSADTNWGDLI